MRKVSRKKRTFLRIEYSQFRRWRAAAGASDPVHTTTGSGSSRMPKRS